MYEIVRIWDGKSMGRLPYVVWRLMAVIGIAVRQGAYCMQ